jgi:prepilin-type N-terminal cleavage/methylation domain-containing protein
VYIKNIKNTVMVNSKKQINKAFSLVELMIVVAILGILAAIVFPEFQNNSEKAKTTAARDNLRILRNAIQLYAAQHNDVPPGYTNDKLDGGITGMNFYWQFVYSGEYISYMPENPFNGLSLTDIIQKGDSLPDSPTDYDTYGWIYDAQTKTIKLNWPGIDSQGIPYYDY